MPGRKIPLITGQYYHVFNRGIAGLPTFTTARTYKRAISLMSFYQNIYPPLKYSHFLKLQHKQRTSMLETVRAKKNFHVSIIAFCIMPNHFHMLLQQLTENGISKFLSDFTNSYTRYYNIRNDRYGPLFQGKFKAVLVETNEQLLHLSRYIHLNPHTSYIIKSLDKLTEYEYSSLPDYLGKGKFNLLDKELIMSHFKSTEKYQEFVFNHADYQRLLKNIEHLLLEK